MAKESNLFITFLKSFGCYIAFALILELGSSMFVSAPLLKEYVPLICALIFIASMYVIYRKKINECIKRFIPDLKEDGIKAILISALLILLEYIIVQILLHFNINSTNQQLAVIELKSSTVPKLIYYVFAGTIVEELCFRLPYLYCDANKKVKYIFYSIVFASIHLLTSGSLLELLYIVPYLLLSFGIGYSYYKTDNILMSTLVHILNNFLGAMLILL